MARGQQKIQSQQKAAKKAEQAKRQQGSDQKAAAMKALNHVCTVCKAQMPDPKTYKQHFENKHPKATLPADLEGVVAWEDLPISFSLLCIVFFYNNGIGRMRNYNT